MSTTPPKLTWADYHDHKEYHGSKGKTRLRATEKPRSKKATARTARREAKRMAGGKPLNAKPDPASEAPAKQERIEAPSTPKSLPGRLPGSRNSSRLLTVALLAGLLGSGGAPLDQKAGVKD